MWARLRLSGAFADGKKPSQASFAQGQEIGYNEPSFIASLASAESAMTEKLFYRDAYKREFTARVVRRVRIKDKPGLVLDRTCFYPASGGQPHDLGTINGVPLLEVLTEGEDIVHLLEGEVAADEVVGKVDWARRFDHMQQHTGQHILSRALKRALGAETVSFHLGKEVSTVDLNRAPLSLEEVERAEELANRVVFENRKVTARFVEEDELARLGLPKPPDLRGPIRVVEVEGFDRSLCGGTHVRSTGEVGLIKVIKAERRGAETRLEFLCGGRALADYRDKNRILQRAASSLTVGFWELPEAVARLQEGNKDLHRRLRLLQERLVGLEATQLLREAEEAGGIRLVVGAFQERSPDELRRLASSLTKEESVIALLGGISGRAHLVFAASKGVPLDMQALLRRVCSLIGGRGGGSRDMAQGSGPVTERLEEALTAARDEVRSELGGGAHGIRSQAS